MYFTETAEALKYRYIKFYKGAHQRKKGEENNF